MEPKIIKATSLKEYLTPEKCFIYENYGKEGENSLSIARARVEPGITTKTHYLDEIQEIYLIFHGKGKVFVGNFEPTIVSEGDVIVIPPKTSQKIQNIGSEDLIFYCICTPRFTANSYHQVNGL